MNKKHRHLSMRTRKAIAGYLFIAPFIIGFIAFLAKPLIDSLWTSFCKVTFDNATNSFSKNFIGLANYKQAFNLDPKFRQLLTEEISTMVIRAISVLVFSFFISLLLNAKFKGRALVRAIFFLPVIVSSGVIVGIETNNQLLSQVADQMKEANTFSSISGTIEKILTTAISGGIGSSVLSTLFEVIDGIYDVAIASGIQIIIFISGLQTISASVYEAADIEGCTTWEKLWKVTFPMISSLLLVNVVYTIVDYCMMRSDSELMTKIKTEYVVNMNYGFSSAMSWIFFVCVGAIVALVTFIISKWVYYYE